MRNKNYFTALICFAAICMTSCQMNSAETNATDNSLTEITSVSETITTESPVSETPVTEAQTSGIYQKFPLSIEDLPSMDGSTSAIPLEAGLKAKLLDVPYFQAKETVHHTKTHISFSNLLSGETDLIFTVPISESQQKAADEAGIHLNMVPVSKESFVFVVNIDNPVDSLTKEQIRDIYSGKITNWSEVGGNDEEIIPYQRNRDSGSQNYMIDFMEGYELCDPPSRLTIGEMGDLMDRIAIYDNSVQSIGYSVYSYAAQMYENSSSVKFIAVDGIKPSRETISNGSYPILSNTYIVYRDDASEKTLKFIDWVLSDEGQQCVLDNGYSPIEDIEFPEYLKLYNDKGTGKPMPENFKPSRVSSLCRTYITTSYISKFEFVKNETLRKQMTEEFASVLEKFSETPNVYMYAENGYLSLKIYSNSETEYLTYDLINNRKIEKYSDLFFQDTDFSSELNKELIDIMDYDYWGDDYQTKVDFLGITGKIDQFSLNSVVLDEHNPYYKRKKSFSFNTGSIFPECVANYSYLRKYMVTGEYFDLKEVMYEDLVEIEDYTYPEWTTAFVKTDSNLFSTRVISSAFHTDEEIEQKNEIYSSIMNDILQYAEHDTDKNADLIVEITQPQNMAGDNNSYNLNVLRASVTNGYLSASTYVHPLSASTYVHPPYCFAYDPDTGIPLTFADVFGDELEDIDYSFVNFQYFLYPDKSDEDKLILIYNNSNNKTYKLDKDKLNLKYFD